MLFLDLEEEEVRHLGLERPRRRRAIPKEVRLYRLYLDNIPQGVFEKDRIYAAARALENRFGSLRVKVYSLTSKDYLDDITTLLPRY